MANTYETFITKPRFTDTADHDMVITLIEQVRVVATDANDNTGESTQRVVLPDPDPASQWVDILNMAEGARADAITAMIPGDKMDELRAAADYQLAKKLLPSAYVTLA